MSESNLSKRYSNEFKKSMVSLHQTVRSDEEKLDRLHLTRQLL